MVINGSRVGMNQGSMIRSKLHYDCLHCCKRIVPFICHLLLLCCIIDWEMESFWDTIDSCEIKFKLLIVFNTLLCPCQITFWIIYYHYLCPSFHQFNIILHPLRLAIPYLYTSISSLRPLKCMWMDMVMNIFVRPERF
jgi:hypothetical protein